MKKSQRGFTVLELLVVLALVGMLTGVVWAYVNQGRGKGKDARRLTDLQTMAKALELYQNENRQYPGTANTAYVSGTGSCVASYTQLNTLLTSSFISNVPRDPDSANCYFYMPDTGNQSYRLFFDPDDASLLTKDSGCTSVEAPAATYYCLAR